MHSDDDMPKELKSIQRDPELGLKIAVVAFLIALAGGGLSFVWERVGWLVTVLAMFGVFVGIGIHWWLNWRGIFHLGGKDKK